MTIDPVEVIRDTRPTPVGGSECDHPWQDIGQEMFVKVSFRHPSGEIMYVRLSCGGCGAFLDEFGDRPSRGKVIRWTRPPLSWGSQFWPGWSVTQP